MTGDNPLGRRRFLKVAGGSAALGLSALAGCTGTNKKYGGVNPGGESLQKMASQTGLPIVKGGPNDLQDSAKVKMVAMDGNEGHGYAFLPAVVWLKPGGMIKWAHEKTHGSKKVSHTVTALSPQNDKPQFVPNGAAGFDSGVLQMAFSSGNSQLKPGTNATALQGQMMNFRYGKRPDMGNIPNAFQGPYMLKFKGPKFPKGVWFYICEDHDFLGMGGSVVVGDVGPGDSGWSPAMKKDLPFPPQLKARFQLIRDKINSQVKS